MDCPPVIGFLSGSALEMKMARELLEYSLAGMRLSAAFRRLLSALSELSELSDPGLVSNQGAPQKYPEFLAERQKSRAPPGEEGQLLEM